MGVADGLGRGFELGGRFCLRLSRLHETGFDQPRLSRTETRCRRDSYTRPGSPGHGCGTPTIDDHTLVGVWRLRDVDDLAGEDQVEVGDLRVRCLRHQRSSPTLVKQRCGRMA
jgi:hypothetical protein